MGEEIRQARNAASLSQREVGRMLGVTHSSIGRMERGDVARLSFERIAVVGAILGLDLHARLYPSGSPVRDGAHLALLERLRKRLGSMLRFRLEVPVPIAGDHRSADGVIDGEDVDAMVEAETRVDDVQALLRRIRAKQRDLGSRRVILLLSDSRNNRSVLAHHPELAAEFPIHPRACLRALSAGVDPGGDAILLL